PDIFLGSLSDQPLSVALNGIMNGVPEIAFAGSVLFSAPVVILFILFEDRIIKGLEAFKW
ncbi:MAG: hypothetical protein FWF03_07860, partial [Defluviitaleaceae bacterium]|nr:hypothetical protein [Defluviitaleaceae bacterium]